MWGRLLMLALGAAAGVLGKVFMDGYNSEGSTSALPGLKPGVFFRGYRWMRSQRITILFY